MRYQIYLDLLFAENVLLSFFLLRLTAFLLKSSATRRRSLAAAFLGAGTAVLYVLVFRHLPGWLQVLIGIGITTEMVQFGCKIKTWEGLAAGWICYLLSVVLMEGAWQLFRNVIGKGGFFFFGITAGTAYSGIFLLQKMYRKMSLYRARTAEVRLIQGGKWKKVRGLYDTGNTLRDTTTEKPVSVIPYQEILELFPDEMRQGLAELLEYRSVTHPESLKELQPRYISFRTLDGGGILLVIRISEMILVQEDTIRQIRDPLIGLGGKKSSSPKGYEMILHPDLMDRQEE